MSLLDLINAAADDDTPPARPGPKGKPPGRVAVPTVLQMEGVECGAASLAMILAHYGRWVPLEELRESCGVSRDGAKALNIVRAGRHYGLEGEGRRMELDEVRVLKPPFVVFWNFNHFLVVEGFSRGRVHLNDPALGKRSVDEAEFSKAFTGIALTFKPGAGFTRGGKRPNVWGGLFERIGAARAAIVFVVLISLLLVVPGFVIPAFSKVFIDEFLVGQQKEWVKPLLWGFGFALLISLSLTWLQQRYLLRLETQLALTSASKMVWHLFSLPVEYFSQRFAGDLAARVQANTRVAKLLSGDLATNIVSLISIVFYGAIMLSYDVMLALVAMALSLANLGALKLVWARRDNANRLLAQNAGKLQATAMGGLVTIETLKAQGAENDFFSRWAGVQAQQVSLTQEIGRYSQILVAVPVLMGGLTSTLVLGLGALEVMRGHLTVGDLVAFQALVASFSGPIKGLVDLGGKLQRVGADLTRIDDVLHYPAPVPSGPPLLGTADRAKLTGAIEIRGVSFGYSKLDPPLITDFDLTVEPGRRVAIVGLSGSGKSTLIKLISGLYRPWTGDVTLDGVPLDRVEPRLLHNSVAVVDQEISLFGGTIRDNISMWDATMTDRAIVRAARDACIHEVVMARPAGYHSVIAEGGRNFSGGERQRLEIARALAIQPTILLLDEATAALDPTTEKLIDDAVRRRGCTCVIVAHRLSTVRDADEIVVMQKGKVVQRGTHETLKLEAEGEYAKLIAAQ